MVPQLLEKEHQHRNAVCLLWSDEHLGCWRARITDQCQQGFSALRHHLSITNNPANSWESKTCLFPDGAVGTTLLTETKHKTFLCLIGLWSSTDALSCLPPVLDAFQGSLSCHLAFHFIQSCQQTNQHRSELSKSTGIHKTIKCSDMNAFVL